MLIVNSVSPGVVPYFADGRHPGRWSPGAGRLLGLAGPVDGRDLRRLLQGRDPDSSRYLPQIRPHRRRAGWDLIFAAPKSVSLLAAIGAGERRSVEDAHVAAVEAVMEQVEERLLLRRGGDGAPRRADGLISAAFDHTTSAAGEPHLHTHVLVANLSCADGIWGAVKCSPWFVDRSGLAALYQLEVRGQLARRGWQLDWRLRPDGLADVADVPRAAVRAASTQNHLVNAAGRYAARAMAAPQPWLDRVAEATGSTPVLSPERSEDDHGGDSLRDPRLERAVALRLTARRSDFRRADVVVALASCHQGGATAPEAIEWAERFCASNQTVPSPTAGRRWTTTAARRADDQLLIELRSRNAAGGTAAVAHLLAERAVRDRLTEEEAEHALALTAGEAPIHFLGSQPGQSSLLAQAEVIEACRDVWDRAGMRVAVWSPTADGALRWSVLTALVPQRAGHRADVLVVDRADRLTTTQLIRLAEGSGGRLVFVEGGTLPRLTNPASHGLRELADEVGRHILPAHSGWAPEAGGGGAAGGGTAAGGSARSVGRSAAQSLLAEWCGRADPPLMVGLGLEETRALNRAALALRRGRPAEAGKGLVAGDRLVVLKARPGLPVYGTFGTVLEAPPTVAGVDGWPARKGGTPVRIAWDNGETTATADRRTLAGVGFGYAVTPYLAARTAGPLMVLGPASAVGRARERVVREVGLEGVGMSRTRAVPSVER